jgi:hypothetical protein
MIGLNKDNKRRRRRRNSHGWLAGFRLSYSEISAAAVEDFGLDDAYHQSTSAC